MPLGALSPSLGVAASPEGFQGSKRHLLLATQSRAACFSLPPTQFCWVDSHVIRPSRNVLQLSFLSLSWFASAAVVCWELLQGRVYSFPWWGSMLPTREKLTIYYLLKGEYFIIYYGTLACLATSVKTGSWGRELIVSIILAWSWGYISPHRNMPAGCKKDSFPTQYKNDLGVFHAECMSVFLKIKKKKLSSYAREN